MCGGKIVDIRGKHSGKREEKRKKSEKIHNDGGRAEGWCER